jgi:hypothetical protein
MDSRDVAGSRRRHDEARMKFVLGDEHLKGSDSGATELSNSIQQSKADS